MAAPEGNQYAKANSKYDDSYPELARKLCAIGANINGVAIFFEVDVQLLIEWIDDQKELRESMIVGYTQFEEFHREREVKKALRREYRKSPHIRERQNKYRAGRIKTIPKERIRANFSGLMRSRLKSKSPGVFATVGYTVEELMAHLESQFIEGMTWDNYGKVWHVDHIKPNKLFNYSSQDDEDFKKCWSLSNLQPLFATDNLKKGSKYDVSTDR